MTNVIQSISLDKLIAHPDNPNKMSKVNFAKLFRNIERTGRYEPLIVRASPEKEGHFQIINGEHRFKALTKTGRKRADCIVWDVDDEQVDIFLSTLNRLGGSDNLAKKLNLLRRLSSRIKTQELGKLLPLSSKQIERLVNLRKPSGPAKIDTRSFANPLVFFVNNEQKETIEGALLSVAEAQEEETRTGRRAAALAHIAEYFVEQTKANLGDLRNYGQT
ncbi:MAG: ParB-like nuclease domain-containing protein [Planctomycetota bacterium]|nr:MAG: ParB-like nuclease domain-containing protein [Planctomycetota bacterium]